MCSYEGRHFGASYPDAQCIDGYLWDLDSYDDGMLTNGGDLPCPACNTDAFLNGAAEDAAGTSWGSAQFEIYCGAMLIEGALRTAREAAPEATAAWCRERGTITAWDWPDRAAVLARRASPETAREVTIVLAPEAKR